MRTGRQTPSVSCSILTLAESGMRWEPSLMPGTQLNPDTEVILRLLRVGVGLVIFEPVERGRESKRSHSWRGGGVGFAMRPSVQGQGQAGAASQEGTGG